MAKRKTAFVCSDCGAEFPRWQGQCSECKAWNTISEFVVSPAKSTAKGNFAGYAGQTHSQIQTLNEINVEESVATLSSERHLALQSRSRL